MMEVAQRYLAVHRIVGDPGPHDRVQQGAGRQAQEDGRGGGTRPAGRHHQGVPASLLSVRRRPQEAGNLAHHLLQPDEQGEVDTDQTTVVLKVLKSLDKVLTADDNPLNPQYLKAKAWTANTTAMTTEELRRAFASGSG